MVGESPEVEEPEFRNDPENYARSQVEGIPKGKPGLTGATINGQPSFVYRDEDGNAVGILRHTGKVVTDVAVLPESRGRGIGTQLVEAAKEEGIEAARGPFTEHGKELVTKAGLKIEGKEEEAHEEETEGEDDPTLSPVEKGWLREFKSNQRKFEKETGKLGLRFDADTTSEKLPAEDLHNFLDAVGDMQVKNLVARGAEDKVKYGGPQDYVRSEGNEFEVPPEPPQIKLMTPRECYANATHMMLRNSRKYDYVEGFYASNHLPMPIEHAWLVEKNTGHVVDPTLGWQPTARYMGVAYPKEFVMKKMLKNKYYGIHSDGNMVNDVVLGITRT